MSDNKVSIIMPVYNASAHLAECLDTVAAQTYGNIEVIMVDDGSTDKSRIIAEGYVEKDPRFMLLCQENRFAGAARNKGIDSATGDYLIFWDSDDLFAPEAVELLYNRIAETDADIVVSGANQLDDETGKILPAPHYLMKSRTPKDSQTFNRLTNPERILNFTTSVVWNKIFRKQFILDNDIRFQEIRNGNDVFFTVVALCKAEKVAYIDKVLMTYRKCQKASLVGTLTSAPIVPINAWRDTAVFLRENDIFPKISFANKAVDSMVYLLRNLPNLDAFSEAVDFLKDGILDMLGISDMAVENYIVKWHADFVDILINRTAKEAFEWMYEFDYKRMASADAEVKILKAEKKKNESRHKKVEEKLIKTEEKNEQLRQNNKKLQSELAERNSQISKMEDVIQSKNKTISSLQSKSDKRAKELKDIKGSASYKIGRIITFIPRKIKNLFK